MGKPPGHDSSPQIPSNHVHAGPVTFEELWAESAGRPGRPAIGLIHDSWAGLVGCAIQMDGVTATVVLDFPSDRLLGTIRAHAGDEGWYIAGQEAHPAGNHRQAMRYVMTLARKTPALQG